MIKFFRKIRQQLLTENKFSRYLLYAIGEIILVVIGILIALQLNNYNDYRKQREAETLMLKNFHRDLVLDTLQANLKINEALISGRTIDTLFVMMANANGNMTSDFLIKTGVLGASTIFVTNNVSFNEAVSGGKMDYILNDKIREGLFQYYNLVMDNLTDKTALKYQQFDIGPMHAEIFLTRNQVVQMITGKPNKLKPITISELSTNPDFNKILAWRKFMTVAQIESWENYKEKANELIKSIELQLK